MRANALVYVPWIALLILGVFPGSDARGLWPRQDTTTNDQSTVASTDGSNPTSATTVPASTDASTLASTDTSTSMSVSTTVHASTTASSKTTSSSILSRVSTSATSAANTSASNSTSTASDSQTSSLPLTPRITPAFGIGGVILIVTGVAYTLIGVKNRWVHIFLSASYLASLAVTVLIIYVINPPVSDAIQGGYLVGIVMTGLIFAAGGLIFKEVTEALGCLLGGFCLSMWLLTLVPGGMITDTTGKGIFVGAFCAVFWSLSFSHHTRVYGLIGCIAFSGSTAVVLGIDCFSRAGLKEFWVYVWALNDKIFALGTSTYPITRGCRVESIVILLGTVIGVMSQIRLWKIVRDKRNKREEAAVDEQRRKEAVEQALGRHLERHYEKDRALWERQYGGNAPPQRNTVPWTSTLAEKGYAHFSSEKPASSCSSPSGSEVEITPVAAKGPSTHGSKGIRLVSVAEDVIPEEQEDAREGSSKSLDSPTSPRKHSPQDAKQSTEFLHPAERETDRDGAKSDVPSSRGGAESGSAAVKASSLQESKHQSDQSMLSLSPRPGMTTFESQETLVRPLSVHSLPSSVAATLDEDEDAVPEPSPARLTRDDSEAPAVAVTPAASSENLQQESPTVGDISAEEGLISLSTPPAILTDIDELDDPEELARQPEGEPEVLSSPSPPSGNDIEEVKGQEANATSEDLSTPRRHSDAVSQPLNVTAKPSSTDALMPDALNHVSGRVSNVVTSYRTNEWAKHITTADVPAFDEPEALRAIDAEPATQLRQPSPIPSATPPKPVTDQPTPAKPEPPPPLATSVAADGAVTINADQTLVTPSERRETDGAVPTASLSQGAALASPINAPRPSAMAPPNRAVSSKLRRTSSRQVFAPPPIAEGVPSSFAPRLGLYRQSSVGVLGRTASASSLALAGQGIAGATRAGTSLDRGATVSQSYSSVKLSAKRRVSTGDSGIVGYIPAALRSETRLSSYESRQPQQQGTAADASRRQSLLAEWRMSQRQDVAVGGRPPLQQVNARRAQMLLDKEQKKVMEDQQKMVQQRQQFAMDEMSRRPDMQDAHREAMRKMQAKTKV